MVKRFTMAMPTELWAKIQAQCIVEGRTPSAIARYAISQYIAQYKVVEPKFIKYAPQWDLKRPK